jgi:integrase
MRDRVQIRVSAGTDPSSGERIVLVDSVPIEASWNERSERAALKEADRRRTKLLADADELKVARIGATVGALLDRWMAQNEIETTTRNDVAGLTSRRSVSLV